VDKSYRQKVEVFTGCPSVVLDRTILSVIGGLVVGIALVILFSTMFPQGIVQNENNEFQVYRLMMADKTFTIPYRFLEGGDAKVTDFEVSLPAMSMTLSVEVLQDNTLEIHLPVEMLKEMENPTSYGYHVGDELVVFVDRQPMMQCGNMVREKKSRLSNLKVAQRQSKSQEHFLFDK
jgi:hypothetical protein